MNLVTESLVTPWGVWVGALVMGAVGSLHCAAMCSPLVCAACSNSCRPEARSVPITGLVTYGLARLVSYGSVGFASGLVGFAAVRYANSLPTRIALSFFVVLLFVVAQWPGVLGRSVPALLERAASFCAGLGVGGGAAGLLGLVTPIVPCGLLWSALIMASQSGGPLHGAGVMMVFALGSSPGLLAGPLLLGGLKQRWKRGWPWIQALLVGLACGMVLWRIWAAGSGTLPCH